MASDSISRRRFLQLSALATAGTALAACAPAAAPAAPDAAEGDTPSTSGETTFVIASLGNPEQNAPLIEAIEAAHPGVTVEWRHMPSERFTELFAAAEVAGDQIDLMDLNGQDLRRYAVGGKLKDLSDIEYKDRFREVGLRTYTINDKLWALPRGGISGFTFLYNKTALEAIGVDKEPESYDELLEWAPQLKEAGYAPVTHSGKNIYLWPVWQFFAYAQTSNNNPVEETWKTLQGEKKFTDEDHVAALEILYRYAQDGMFIEGVNSFETDGAWQTLSQGKAAFWYHHTGQISVYRGGDFPALDLSLIQPIRSVQDSSINRMMPGGTGAADGIYANIAEERLELAQSILDLMTSDEWVKWANEVNADPVSTNANVEASDDPLSLKYAEECAPLQFTYLDWYWPPEITRAFQENQQAIVAGTKTPDAAAESIQGVLDELYADGYTFEI
jgi:raffinose/stachyose/melibiose transport system substrate-binding protein